MSITVSNEHENPEIDRLSKDDKLRWVLQFLQTDVNKHSQSQQEQLGDDFYHAAVSLWGRRCRGAPLTAGQVQELHEKIRGGLQTLMTQPVMDVILLGLPHVPTPGWEIPETRSFFARVQFPSDKWPRFLRIHPPQSDPLVAVLQGVTDLVEAADDRLRVCPECGNLFVRRRRQECCTERCAQKRRNRRRATSKGAHRQRRTAASLGAPSA
jgi:hypothetical protein